MLNIFFSLADNDTDRSKTHLNKAEQIINLIFNYVFRIQKILPQVRRGQPTSHFVKTQAE